MFGEHCGIQCMMGTAWSGIQNKKSPFKTSTILWLVDIKPTAEEQKGGTDVELVSLKQNKIVSVFILKITGYIYERYGRAY